MKERGAGAPSSERRGLEDLARIAKSLAQSDHAVAQLGALAAENKRLLDARISAVLLWSVARATDEFTVLSYTQLVSWSRHPVRHLSGRR